MPRQHGTGRIYVKWGAYNGRWRTADGRYVNRRLGKIHQRDDKEGLSRREAGGVLRRSIEAESLRPCPHRMSVDDVANALRDRLLIEGARLSYRQNCESMQRIHISPGLGKRHVDRVTTVAAGWSASSTPFCAPASCSALSVPPALRHWHCCPIRPW